MNWREILHSIPINPQLDPLMIFGIILIGGAMGGWVARRMRLPSVTGNILAGVALGPSLLNIIRGEDVIQGLMPLSSFAMGLITVSIGGHLSYRRIHNALSRIILISLCEVSFVVILVGAVTYWISRDWTLALILGTVSAATAPATIVAIIRENHARGPYVKTILSVVALDNILAITLFAIVRTLIGDFHQGDTFEFHLGRSMLLPAWQLVGAALLGLALGKLTDLMVRRPQLHNFSTIFIAILMAMGLSSYLGLNQLLTCLFFGVYLGNASREVEAQIDALEPIELLLYICFFTMAGVTLHLQELSHLGLLGVAYIIARIVGKGLGATVGGGLSGSSRRIWSNIGLSLMPQAGLAIALVVLLLGDERIPEHISQTVASLVLAAVVFNEIIGPLGVRLALGRVNEIGKDRPRLIEFLQEEFILTGMRPHDKWDAIRQLCDFLIRTHRVEHIHPDELYASVIEREKIEPTAIGHGAAIPHGIIDEGPFIQGVLGICKRGVDFGAPDDKPVRIIMLIVTPKGQRDQHLKVMASLAEMISDHSILSHLIGATDSNHAWEIIESEETPAYNYFLED